MQKTADDTFFTKKKFLLNSLITLYCRILRLSILDEHLAFNKIEEISEIFCEEISLENSENFENKNAENFENFENSGNFENFENKNAENSLNFSFIMQKPVLIYLELINQFQSAEIPPLNKLKRSIEEFKEKSLTNIYIFAMNNLITFLNDNESFSSTNSKKYQNDTFFVDICAKLIYECLDYEEDLNIKDFNFNKFQIKPGNIPNGKRVKLKDKQININSMIEFINAIFKVHNAISVLNTK